MTPAGLQTTAIYMAATGIAFVGVAQVASISILAPGSSGNWLVEEAAVTGQANSIRHPSTAYTALKAGDEIKFSAGGASEFGSMYLTLPTGAEALVNILPR